MASIRYLDTFSTLDKSLVASVSFGELYWPAREMATLDEELEDLVTCSVCLLEYNQDERKPKYLQCYHVLCLQCLTVHAEN